MTAVSTSQKQVLEATDAARSDPSLAPRVRRSGPLDRATTAEILAAFDQLPWWPPEGRKLRRYTDPALAILNWLTTFPGDTWQERWQTAEALHEAKWAGGMVTELATATSHERSYLSVALGTLIQVGLLRPGYHALRSMRCVKVHERIRDLVSPELFARAEAAGARLGMPETSLRLSLTVLTSILIGTGKALEEVTTEDLMEFCACWSIPGRRVPDGTHGAWQLLVEVGQFPHGSTLSDACKPGQRPTAELIDQHGITSPSVRQVLIRYCDERRPALDYSTLRGIVGCLARSFWADIERHHPGIDSLDLPDEVVTAWKERLRYITRRGQQVPRKNYLEILMQVRSFYLDIAEWALEDPSWTPWAVPCPIRRGETDGFAKEQRATQAAMHQRTRERLPHLPSMIDAAEDWRDEAAALLAIAAQTPIDESFECRGRTYRRTSNKTTRASSPHTAQVKVVDLASGETIDVTNLEDHAFWAWACTEMLRHTGIRVEELLELTHLALVSYRLPDTGEVVPLLQIVPSKSGEERLLLVAPELASVLARIIQRLRGSDGTVPLVQRYDPHERTTSAALPHLLQRRYGWRRHVVSASMVQKLLNAVLERTGLTDQAGEPLRYTPHDFRRIFTTEAVTGGLPIHIAAKILGHANINTTQGYAAVFQEELIRSYRSFVDRRRADRPSEEYREPTSEEWIDFQEHFALRKVELGTCGRPYGTPCAHEHACIRCPMLRVDPRAKGRLQEVIANLTERIEEAQANGWLGEIEGLKTSQRAAIGKLVALNRAERNALSSTSLDLPTIRRKVRDERRDV